MGGHSDKDLCVESSQQYFPVIIDPGLYGYTRNRVYEDLKQEQIFSRKYFHPVCTDFEPYKTSDIVTTNATAYVDKVKDQVVQCKALAAKRWLLEKINAME